jgi:hypothetical protein
MLNRMEQANLFLTALDDQCCWYRYHPLFAGFLRRGSPPDRDQPDLAAQAGAESSAGRRAGSRPTDCFKKRLSRPWPAGISITPPG